MENIDTTYTRGEAITRLEMPSNLLTASGLLTAVFGFTMSAFAIWPVVANGAPINIDVCLESLIGLSAIVWGIVVCYAASQMAGLGSYRWAVVGSLMGIAPLFVGLYALFVLTDRRIPAAFGNQTSICEEFYEDDSYKPRE